MPNCSECGSEVSGDVCPNCGAQLTPSQARDLQPGYKQVPPPFQRKPRNYAFDFIIGGVIIGIIIVTLALSFVLLVDDGHNWNTPHASMTRQETDASGKYIILWSGSVEGDMIDIILYDDSLGRTEVEERPSGSISGLLIQVTGGCNLTWYDNNDNNKLDGADTMIMQGAASGDRVTVTYRPTGETVATCPISR